MGSGSGGWWGVVFLCKKKESEKGKGVERGGGWVETGEGTGKSMRTRLSKLRFSKLPSRFSPIEKMLTAQNPRNPEKLKVTRK